jgi:hypothetical protein
MEPRFKHGNKGHGSASSMIGPFRLSRRSMAVADLNGRISEFDGITKLTELTELLKEKEREIENHSSIPLIPKIP